MSRLIAPLLWLAALPAHLVARPEENTIRRLHSMAWMLVTTAAALSGALTVTLADAGERPSAGLVRWSTRRRPCWPR